MVNVLLRIQIVYKKKRDLVHLLKQPPSVDRVAYTIMVLLYAMYLVVR